MVRVRVRLRVRVRVGVRVRVRVRLGQRRSTPGGVLRGALALGGCLYLKRY